MVGGSRAGLRGVVIGVEAGAAAGDLLEAARGVRAIEDVALDRRAVVVRRRPGEVDDAVRFRRLESGSRRDADRRVIGGEEAVAARLAGDRRQRRAAVGAARDAAADAAV